MAIIINLKPIKEIIFLKDLRGLTESEILKILEEEEKEKTKNRPNDKVLQ